jgi:hypothetical protein
MEQNKFIELTQKDRKILVNTGNISAVYTSHNETLILLAGKDASVNSAISVLESYEEVKSLLPRH